MMFIEAFLHENISEIFVVLVHPTLPVFISSVRCFPVMPAELAWLFATRPVFLYPELLPCASLDPALYCPRRTAAFTAAEDW